MCYPLYKYEKELEKPYHPADGWISFSSGTLGSDPHERSLELYARIEPRSDFNNEDGKPVRTEAEAA